MVVVSLVTAACVRRHLAGTLLFYVCHASGARVHLRQWTWLRAGAPFLPYLVTDRVVAPESCRKCYSEHLVLMPNCYFVNDYKRAHMVPPPPAPRSRDQTVPTSL